MLAPCLPAARLCPPLLGRSCLAALVCVWVWVCAGCAVLRSGSFSFPYSCHFLDSTRVAYEKNSFCAHSRIQDFYMFLSRPLSRHVNGSILSLGAETRTERS